MNRIYTKIALSLILAGLLIGSLATGGCNSYPPVGSTGSIYNYQVVGGLVKDANINFARLGMSLARNDSTVSSAIIMFDTDTLVYNHFLFAVDSVYSLSATLGAIYARDSVPVRIVDSTRFDGSFMASVPGMISITEFSPPNHLIAGNGSVTVAFSTSLNVAGYVVAAVLDGEEYSGTGWSQYTESFANAGTIPPEAFLDSNGQNTVPGLYQIYVYAFNDTPDSSLTTKLLPVPMPSQLDDNISQKNLSGRFGTIVVSLMDTVRVAQQ